MPMYKIILLIFLLLPRSLFAEAGVIKIASSISDKNNQLMRAIPFPIYRGLLGQRVFIIDKDNLAKFQAIVSPSQLKALTACQGMY